MSSKRYPMFAAVKIDDPYHGPTCVNWYANAVRRELGRMFDGKDDAAGWKAAMRQGWRVRRVYVEVLLP